MTTFAGVFPLTPSQGIPASLKDAMSSNVSRSPKGIGTWTTCDTPRIFITKWDSNAFNQPAWLTSDDGCISALAGDPILLSDDNRINRQQQLTRLSSPSRAALAETLAQCRGSFAFAHFSAPHDELRLATDAVGLRSVYYALHDGLLIFATALRMLEAIPELCKDLSELGMAELCMFSFPLADRTPYDKIKILRESQMLCATHSGIVLNQYKKRALPVASHDKPQTAAAALHTEFKRAVELRAGTDDRVYSFLSGGMDSRAILATLVESGRYVEALNFSPDNSQDRLYAQLLAAQVADTCRLHCRHSGGSYPNFSLLAHAAKQRLEREVTIDVSRPQMIWSGDGGSVGLGHVYMNEQMALLKSAHSADALTKEFFKFNRLALATGVFRSGAADRLPKSLFDSVRSEIDRYSTDDAGRAVFLFLLFNDQRRHLFKHFESIDQHGLELLTPFYDAAFLSIVATVPFEWCILHKLYASFFELLPAFARLTPWQTYPGHVPCPVNTTATASYQWEKPKSLMQLGLGERARLSLALVRATDSQARGPILSGPKIWLAATLHLMGLRDCGHVLPVLQNYQRHSMTARARSELLRLETHV